MILGPISYLDCIVFCVFLAPQLLIHVGLFETVGVALQCLPFLPNSAQTPLRVHSRALLREPLKAEPLCAGSEPFRGFRDPLRAVCVCKRAAQGRQGVLLEAGGVVVSKVSDVEAWFSAEAGYEADGLQKRFKGIWVTKDPTKKPDVCIYYAHGGGFSMGSSYFYLEFLLAWLTLLGDSGFSNPAVFALEYTLVPDDTFPKQMHEAIAGYDHVVSMVGDASKICVSGDSAGATVLLSLLLHIADQGCDREKMDESSAWKLPKPGMAAFISPWVTLVSNRHKNTASDYLDAGSLHQYAREYVGKQSRADDPLISPGNCRDLSWWKRACPAGGMFFAYGAEEVFAPEIENLLKFLEKNKIHVASREEPGGIHAWPVAALFLASSTEDRQRGLRSIVRYVKDNIPSS
ncbi:hypothetical protein TruAng_002467 [Truncatella angustata]|nr:hypothetical protein TruAng_002467 [Truncatella angustata]